VRTAKLALTVLTLALVPAGVACTSGGTSTTTPTTTTTAETPSSLPTVNEAFTVVDGEYTYENEGVKVALTWKGGTGDLSIHNGSGTDLQAPGLYAVTATDQEVQATVGDAATVLDGQSATLKVTFPASLKPEDAGLIVLEFGDQNWGALSPVVTSAGSASPSA
jgi:hypothetical protein